MTTLVSRRELDGRPDRSTHDPADYVATDEHIDATGDARDVSVQSHAELLVRWRDLDAREAALKQGKTLTISELDGERRTRQVLDEIELVTLRAAIQRERQEVAPLLLAARERIAAAKRQAANDQLVPIVDQWRARCDQIAAQQDRVALALVALFHDVEALRELTEVERRLHREAMSVAKAGVDDDALRADLTRSRHDVMPVRVGRGEIQTVDRPERGLFANELADTQSGRFWQRIAEVLPLPREQAVKELSHGSAPERRLAELITNPR